LIEKPRNARASQFSLTPNGNKICDSIKALPDFIDHPGKGKADMVLIKELIRANHPDLYKLLKEVFLTSDSLKNLAIFLKSENVYNIDIQKFYKSYGKIFSIDTAGFNRLPSLIQLAQFCDILIEDSSGMHIYDTEYIDNFAISSPKDSLVKIIGKDIQKPKVKGRTQTESDESDDYEFLKDISEKVIPEKKKALISVFKRNKKISNKLKKLYKGECQICGFTFDKKGGKKYSEAHHIIPLGEQGSEKVTNMIIVCANCHRQLHYANPVWKGLATNIRHLEINGQPKEVRYKPAHFSAIKESDV
jgi:predicted restriction endonuclease